MRMRRVYDAVDPDDGRRVLVDRLWPRGIAKTDPRVGDRGQPFSIELDIELREATKGLDVSCYVSSNRGVRVIDEALSDRGVLLDGPGRFRATFSVPAVLNVGDYTVGVWIGTGYEQRVWRDDLLRFTLTGDSQGRLERLVRLDVEWQVGEIPTSEEEA